jgi:integrase
VVVSRKNKPTEVRSKQIIYRCHLEPRFGSMPLDEITVKQQTCNGETTTPKGRTRRTVPMTSTLYDALKRMITIREGFVVRNLDGSQKFDGEANHALARMCRRAKLPIATGTP